MSELLVAILIARTNNLGQCTMIKTKKLFLGMPLSLCLRLGNIDNDLGNFTIQERFLKHFSCRTIYNIISTTNVVEIYFNQRHLLEA